MPRQYRAYGCIVASDLDLPAFPEAEGHADVHVRLGRAPGHLQEARGHGVCFSAAPGEALVSLDGIARLHVKHGAEILVDAVPGVDDATLQLFVTTLAFGLLLHQRGDIVLHAAAVQDGDMCVALAGASSAGKSTVAAALLRQGHRIATDDLCVVRPGRNGHVVVPGPPQLLLWADALRMLGHTPGTLAAVRPGLQRHALPLGTSHADAALPLKAIYVLQPWVHDETQMVPLTGLRRFEAVASSVYRPEYIRPLGLEAAHFHRLSSLSNIPVAVIKGPRTWRSMDALIERLAVGAAAAR